MSAQLILFILGQTSIFIISFQKQSICWELKNHKKQKVVVENLVIKTDLGQHNGPTQRNVYASQWDTINFSFSVTCQVFTSNCCGFIESHTACYYIVSEASGVHICYHIQIASKYKKIQLILFRHHFPHKIIFPR